MLIQEFLRSLPAFSMRSIRRLFALAAASLLVLLALALASCSSFDGAADFAAKAQQAIDEGAPILSDLKGSCLRRHLADVPLTEFKSLDTSAAACSEFADQEQGMNATTKVLSDYFAAISQLASAGTTAIGDQNSSAASSAAKLAHLSSGQSTAVASLASLAASQGVEAYKKKQIVAVLQKADSSVAEITEGLVTIINSDYLGSELVKEQQALNRRSNNFADRVASDQQLKASAPVVTILLQMQWKTDLEQLSAKRAAASAYAKALTKIAEGHHALTTQGARLKGKDLANLMQAYTESLIILTKKFDKSH